MKLRDLLQLIDKVHTKYNTSIPYICGGLPRDKYLNRLLSVADVDFTTGDETINTLSLGTYRVLKRKFNIKREKKQDGHSSIYFNNMKIDFSSNYTAPNIDIHLKKIGISNATSLQKEAYSRDFGCNSLLLSMDFKQLLDPTNQGFKDCDNKIIKPLISPEVTFAVNPETGMNNRAIRAIYLACKLDFTIDPTTVNYIKNNPYLIEQSEPKTLAKKINKAYQLNPEKAKYYLDKMNLYNYIPINSMLSDQVLELLSNRVSNV